MEDYKEPISRVQKRRQLKRLFAIMGSMILAFLIFVLGVIVGIRLEKERMRIAGGTAPRVAISKEKRVPGGEGESKTPSSSEKKEEEMRFTFYEILTKKEGSEDKRGEEEKARVTEGVKEEEKKAQTPPPPAKKVEEVKRTLVKSDLYFVQVGSFREKGRAEVLKNTLEKRGYKIHVTPVEIEDSGLWYRVMLGGYESLQEAQAIQKKMIEEENLKEARVIPGS